MKTNLKERKDKTLSFFSNEPKRGYLLFIFVFITLLFLIPFWSFKYMPFQDNPNHLLSINIINNINNQSLGYKDYFIVNFSIFKPYSLYFIIMIPLTKIFSLFTAEKIFLSLYIILFVISFLMVVKEIHKGNLFLGTIIFLFIFNWTLQMGFYQYILSIPIFFFALAYYIRHPQLNTLKELFIFNLFLLLLFYSHILSLAAFIVTALVIEFLNRKNFKFLFFCVKISPVLILFLITNLFYSSSNNLVPVYSSFLNNIFDISRWFYYYNEFDRLVFVIVFVFEGYIFINIIRNPSPVYQKKYLIAGLTLFTLYLIIPKAFNNNAWFINTRFIPYFLLLPVLSFNQKVRAGIKHFFLILILFTSIFILIHNINIFKTQNEKIENYTSGIKYITKNPKILPITVPINSRTNPLLHAWAYYNIEKGGVSPFSFAAAGFHPVEFKQKPIDKYLPSPGEYTIDFLNSKMILFYDYVFLSGKDERISNILNQNYFKIIYSNKIITIWKNSAKGMMPKEE